MNTRLRHKGFSLTEVMLAAGILMVGFVMIASIMPVAVKLTAISTERTIGAVAADEAFAKIRLLGVQDVDNKAVWIFDPNILCVDYSSVAGGNPNRSWFTYPSTDIRPDTKKYYWSAICKYEKYDPDNLLDLDCFQVTVFVSRHTGLDVTYPRRDYIGGGLGAFAYPRAVPIPVRAIGAGLVDYIEIDVTADATLVNYVTDGSTLVDARTGQIMRVLSRDRRYPEQLRLEKAVFDADAGFGDRFVWVVPPAIDSGRYPCVGVYQRMVKFK